MSNMDRVLERLAQGDRIKFFHDFYGRQWIELSSGRILPRKTRIDLLPDEIRQIKDMLRARRATSDLKKAG